MKIRYLFLLLLPFIIGLGACQEHFIKDREYRIRVKKQFEITKELASKRNARLFSVFDEDISLREKEALEFLFAYMPLSDLADYDGEFFLQNVRSSMAARDTFSWGKTIPDDIFRHFVLPVRVNNENLDSARIVFFDELKDRIRKMDMKEAALEVNHWCHEKVTYKGTDGRTSSPLATVKTAFGRCGEESTLTVAAMRAVCIPARQCYTPRWAHQDDNHAWVEVWIGGKWHYLGACEPDADLDMGWFSSHAKRAMLVNTTVFGDYTGSEDILKKEERFTQINVLPNYTDTKKLWVKVKDAGGEPVDSASVEFGLYNYAEFYPLSKQLTDEKGLCSLLTGHGDLLIWAAKGGNFGFSKISAGTTDTLSIVLEMTPGKEFSLSYDFVPPAEQPVNQEVSDSLKKINAERLAYEDRARENYEKTFIDSARSYRLAATLGINGDTLFDILKKSRGNYREIIDFISSVPQERQQWTFPLLLAISEKDLRDINPEVLFDQMNSAWRFTGTFPDRNLFVNCVLNPRISNEFLKPYQTYFQTSFDENFIKKIISDPQQLVEWTRTNIAIDTKSNYSRAPLTPVGVYELQVADPASRDIFFVAVCRSFGIPARVETSSGISQYYSHGKWVDVQFDKPEAVENSRATIVLEKDPSGTKIDPAYYIHFTVEQYKNGFFRSLDYENDPSVSVFPASISVPPGYYMMVTGNRVDKGIVLARLTFFNAEAGKEKKVLLTIRNKPAENAASRMVDLPSLLSAVTGKTFSGGSKATVIAWLEPEKEPSRHFIADLLRLKNDFEKWSGSIVLIFNTENEKKIFLDKNPAGLPGNISLFAAPNSVREYEKITGTNDPEFPLILMAGADGKILYQSSGYRIGAGDDLIRLTK